MAAWPSYSHLPGRWFRSSSLPLNLNLGITIWQVSMSSTSIVIKCLSDARQNGALHGQITIGTLILQVQMPHKNPERDMQAQCLELSLMPLLLPYSHQAAALDLLARRAVGPIKPFV